VERIDGPSREHPGASSRAAFDPACPEEHPSSRHRSSRSDKPQEVMIPGTRRRQRHAQQYVDSVDCAPGTEKVLSAFGIEK
jgi:hypothetical protein